ncbi:MAG: HalOD1 output domain-containing protein [Haloplanus sp.]
MATANEGWQLTEAHRVEIDWDRREPVSMAVQVALSDARNESPTELDPLADYVDPEAIEQFFAGDVTDVADRNLTFTYDGSHVYVDGAGYVLVD